MKIIIFILIGAIGLTGCTTVGRYLDNQFPHTVKVFSPEVERGLGEIAEIDVKDIALVLFIEKKDRIRVLRSKYVMVKKPVFPIKTTEISKITSISVVNYNGSDCTIVEFRGNAKTFCPTRRRGESGGTKSEHYSSVKDLQYSNVPYPPVKVLSQSVERELGKIGIKDLSLALAFDKKGSIYILRSDSVTEKEVPFPIREIARVTPITAVNYKGSDCTVVKAGGMPYCACPDPNVTE